MPKDNGAPAVGDLVIVKGAIGPPKLVTRTRGVWILIVSGSHENWVRRTDVRIVNADR